MKILHILSSMSPEGGGPQEAVRTIVRYAPTGYSNEVVTLDDPAAPFLASMPFPVHALGGKKKSWCSPRLLTWLRANRNRFDGVMLHGLWEFTGIATLLTIAGHKPYAVFPHGMLDPYFKRAFPTKHLKKSVYWLLAEYWILRRSFRVLFTTATERDLATQSFWLHRWTPMVVALGAEMPQHEPAAALAAFYDRCPAVRGHNFLLFLGRLDRKKGCDQLLEAFASVQQQAPGLHLVMAGPDLTHWRAELEDSAAGLGIAPRVHWPGMIAGDAKWGAFEACDAFILPSHQENFGIAVVESLACGRPVLLSTPINIAADLAADGCALVEPDTLDGTRNLLTRWLSLSAGQRAAMGAQARATFAARYNMRSNSAAILRVFEQLPGVPVKSLAEAH